MALRITAIFRSSPSSDRPAPRPVTSSTRRPSSTAVTAAAVVVLPMPISPAANRRYPLPLSSSASVMPVTTAATASSRVMAGPLAMLLVPRVTWRRSRPPSSTGWAIPMSTGNTCAPAVQAMRQTQASPQAMEAATEAVTSGPVWVTPSSVTPLSAQKTASAFLSRLTSAVPWTPAARITASSSRPRPPMGLAMESQRRAASAIAP